ncbi:coat protein [ssRNA phage SRR5467091_14]|uniref:Coat protein n=1 Tax=ssRNA phage SRR5467091_14 TaxID=2786464 RepID=A0A8S5L477_9VIRU|nr:coat protein [ssRNA phage SRR5467091_14]DAD52496.1 TPA_asm: coat protein [ssRNA phage SRR5467091_14]
MSFSDPLGITYNAVVKNLVRVNQDKNGADYFLDGGTLQYSISTRHTIPARGAPGESHMIRLDVDEFDAQSVYLRRSGVWLVVKTFDNVQSTTNAGYAANALVGLMTSGNVGKLLAREY